MTLIIVQFASLSYLSLLTLNSSLPDIFILLLSCFSSYLFWVLFLFYFLASLVAQRVKRLPAMQETWVRSLGQEDPLGKEMATHSSTLAWKIPWTEKPGRLRSMGSQRVGHNWATSLSLSFCNAWYFFPHSFIFILHWEWFSWNQYITEFCFSPNLIVSVFYGRIRFIAHVLSSLM